MRVSRRNEQVSAPYALAQIMMKKYSRKGVFDRCFFFCPVYADINENSFSSGMNYHFLYQASVRHA
jgi:hypothetical protein